MTEAKTQGRAPRVLVAYATKCGSSAEVAEEVGKTLAARGAEVEVVPARRAHGIEGYDAYVLGTAIRMGKPLAEMRRFVAKRKRLISRKPVAVFSVGLAPRGGELEEARGFISGVAEAVGAMTVATFAGAVFADRLRFPFSAAAKNPDGALPEGDYRDWDAIRSWADEAADRLLA